MKSITINVLLFSRYTQLGASSRLRFYQYLPYLKNVGINVTVAPLLDDEYIRGLYGNNISIYSVLKAYINRLNLMRKADQFDVVWVEKEMLPWIPSWIEFGLFPSNVPLVIDYDDAVFHRYDQHKLSLVRCILGRKIDDVMKHANLVITGNEYLAARSRSAGACRVEIIPTVVDITRYAVSESIKNEVTVIGWIGSPSTAKFLHQIAPALKEVVATRKIKVVAVGANTNQLNDLPITILPWSEEAEVRDIQHFDIGIMPLPDELFERGKCGYKLIQCMACGKPVVASPVGVNNIIVIEGIEGFLATTHAEWVTALTKLIDNSELRKEMGRAGRQKVEKEYCLSAVMVKLPGLLRSVTMQDVIKYTDVDHRAATYPAATYLSDNASMEHASRLAIITSQAFSISNFRGPLVSEMVRAGMTVYALAPDYDDATRAAVAALGAVPIDSPMSRTGMNPFLDVFNMIRLTFLLRSLNLDIAFAYFIKPVIYGLLAASLADVPKRFAIIEGAGYVFTDSGKSSMYRKLLRSFVTKLYWLGLTQAQRVFMLNRDDEKLFVESKMVAAAKVQLINGIGLDLDYYQVVPVTLQQPCFILIARLLLEKGIYDYVEAARKVKAIHPCVRFLLLGNVDFNPSSISESEVQAWVAEGVVEWPGQVSDVRPWIAEASVFVLPSYREGLPRSAQEAMAMGRPVITTDVPGCRETVVDGVNGFLIPVRNPEALAQAMLRFIEQPLLVSAMGAESSRIAKRKFDVHKINAEILAAMEVLK